MTAVDGQLAMRFPAMASWDFRRLFVNGFLTTGSRWAQVLARGWLVHDLSGGSGGAVGLATFASFIPFVVVGPMAGAVADRFDRRRLLIGATIFGIVGATVLAAITLAGVVEVWHVVALAFFTGAAQAAAVPSRQALIANVVPEEHLLNAVALGGISQHGSRVIGPLFGAAFLALLGPGSVFAVSAVLLSLSLIEAVRLRYRAEPRPDSPLTAVAGAHGVGDAHQSGDGAAVIVGRLLGDLASAGRYVRADRRLLTVISLVGAHCSLTMAFDAMMPILSERVGGSSTLYSAILVGLGSGAIVGTLTVSQLQRERSRGAVFAAVAFGSGLAMVVMGTATTPAAVVAGAVLAGLTQASYMTMSAALIQKIVSDEFRGRVMSLYIMIAAGHMAILNLGFGRAADDIDVRLLLVGPGLAWIAVLMASLAVLPELRWMVSRGRFVSMSIAGAE